MKIFIGVIIAIVIVISAAFVTGAVFIVSESTQAVITQFGKPIGDPVTEAGLHFKFPYPIQMAQFFDKRLLEWDGDPNQIPTRDKKYIWVDTTARWKISDALKFLQSMGSERNAQARLDDIINSATRDAVTQNMLVEVTRNSNRVLEEQEGAAIVLFADEALETIKSGRKALEAQILKTAEKITPQYGIDIVDVRIKTVNYVEDVREKVYERMISERKRAAEEYRSEGRGKSAEITGKMEKELKQITSEAYKKSQLIRGKADAKATAVYAEAYTKDPDFFAFMKTLDTYKDSIDTGSSILMTTDSDYFKYLKKIDG